VKLALKASRYIIQITRAVEHSESTNSAKAEMSTESVLGF